jgi:hypothetical protein
VRTAIEGALPPSAAMTVLGDQVPATDRFRMRS